MLAKYFTDDDFSRWFKYGTYGKYFVARKGMEWTVFSGKYLETKDRWENTDIQIRTFYRIMFDYDISDAKIWYYNDNEVFTNYRFVELHLKLKMIASDTVLKVEVLYTEDKKEKVISSVQLTSKNSCLEKVHEGYKISTYLYSDVKALKQYLLEFHPAMEGKYTYVYVPEMASYPSPAKYNIDNSLLFDRCPAAALQIPALSCCTQVTTVPPVLSFELIMHSTSPLSIFPSSLL